MDGRLPARYIFHAITIGSRAGHGHWNQLKSEAAYSIVTDCVSLRNALIHRATAEKDRSRSPHLLAGPISHDRTVPACPRPGIAPRRQMPSNEKPPARQGSNAATPFCERTDSMPPDWPEKIEAAQLDRFFSAGGKQVERIRFGDGTWTMPASEVCHGCDVVKGQYHVRGCDMEECPVCHGEALGCKCLDG